MKLNGQIVYIATLLIVAAFGAVWLKILSRDILTGVIMMVAGYYFGSYRGIKQNGGGS